MNGAVKAETGDTGAHAIRRSERGAEAFAKAERHSRRVRLLKFVLPAAAIMVSGLFLGYSFLSSMNTGAVGLDSATIEDGKLVMHNPSLDGFTGENLPYSMSAARARQVIGSDTAAIDLEEISASLPIDKDNRATISAGAGVFDRQNDRLMLTDTITVTMTTGIVARMQSAEVDIGSNNLTTDEPVEIEMDGMRVRADAFRASDGGKKLIFEDHVRVEIDPAGMRRAQEQIDESRGNE